MTNAELRQKLIEQVKQQGKPFGLLIDDIAGGFTFTGRSNPQAFQVQPLVVYKVFPDGRPDELVRGVDIVGTPLVSLTKIVATGDTHGNLQRLLRRGIGFRAGVGRVARHADFRNGSRRRRKLPRTSRRSCRRRRTIRKRRGKRNEEIRHCDCGIARFSSAIAAREPHAGASARARGRHRPDASRHAR